MSDPAGIAEQYVLAAESFIDLARTLEPSEWATVVPCTPAWTVRDVLSHLSGIPDDAAAGRMEGAPGEAWTAAQIQRNREFGVDELLARWSNQAPALAAMISQTGEGRPPIDCHSHEHDVRHALGRAANRSSPIVEDHGFAFASIDDAPAQLVVELADGRVVTSGRAGAPVVVRGMTTFELFRSRLGRRSRDQVRGYDWTGADSAIDAIVDRWFIFGPSSTPIEE